MKTILLPNLDDLYTATGLYSPIDLSQLEKEEIINFIDRVRKAEKPIDAYCIECKEKSTFNGYQISSNTILNDGEDGIDNIIFGVELRCVRDSQHRIFTFFLIDDAKLIKIGQSPSIADLSVPKTIPYRKILGNEMYKEFTKAIGLNAHGIGVGAFVYLRRIFENLLEEAHNNAKRQSTWDEDSYQRLRVDQKIPLLKDYLPTFFVENKILYAILSKGIHSLDEDECVKYFDAVRLGIELILDEKLEQQKKLEKIAQAKQAIQQIRQTIQSNGVTDGN
jgi:hypothetical protein